MLVPQRSCPPLPRLLAVLIRQVGRASSNVQCSNASLAIDDDLFSDQTSSVPPAVDAPTARGGGEDSNGMASATATSLPKETPLLLRGMRLRRDEPGRAAAHRDLSVRHSMSMWVSGLSVEIQRVFGVGRLMGSVFPHHVYVSTAAVLCAYWGM